MDEAQPIPEDREQRGRGLRAVALVLGLLLVAAFAATRLGRDPSPDRLVQSSAPDQVTPPGRLPVRAAGTVEVGADAPDLALPDLSGTMISLAQLRGRVVVLNMWASWCPPCIAEMPALEVLHRDAGGGLVVLTVSVDESRADVRGVVSRLGLTFPVLLDPGGPRCAAWGTVKFPETWVIDPRGRVARRLVGAVDWADPQVRAFLAAEALDESPSAP